MRLDYCYAVLADLPAATLAPLQRFLYAAARLVNNLRSLDHVTSATQGAPLLLLVQPSRPFTVLARS